MCECLLQTREIWEHRQGKMFLLFFLSIVFLGSLLPHRDKSSWCGVTLNQTAPSNRIVVLRQSSVLHGHFKNLRLTQYRACEQPIVKRLYFRRIRKLIRRKFGKKNKNLPSFSKKKKEREKRKIKKQRRRHVSCFSTSITASSDSIFYQPDERSGLLSTSRMRDRLRRDVTQRSTWSQQELDRQAN